MLQFLRYFMVGIINTAVYWGIFYVVLHFYGLQSAASAVAFIAAVSVSYILNSTVTFKQNPTGKKFVFFTIFMGLISVSAGFAGDTLNIPPLATLVFSSSFSLVAGFLFSKFIVFRT